MVLIILLYKELSKISCLSYHFYEKHQTHKTTVFFYYANMSNNLQQELIKTKKTKKQNEERGRKTIHQNVTGSYISIRIPQHTKLFIDIKHCFCGYSIMNLTIFEIENYLP